MDGKSLNSRSAALGLWTALVLCTAVVASRRLAGAYTGTLPTAALSIAVILAVTVSVVALWLFRRDQPRTCQRRTSATGSASVLPSEQPLSQSLKSALAEPVAHVWPIIKWLPELTAWGLPTLFSLVIAASATPAQSGALLGIAAIGAVVLGVAVLETTDWWMNLLSSNPTETEAVPSEGIVDTGGTNRGSAGASPSLLEDEPPIEDDIGDESTTQWMTRRDEPDGEAIEGTVRVHFASGQREAVVHVTFCPPLPSPPDVELECIDGDEWQLKPEVALPYGLRIQVRRSTSVTFEQSGRVAYLATSQRPARAA